MMGRHCYVLLRRRYDVPIRLHGDMLLRRHGDVPSRRRWVFHLERTCDVAGTYREASLRRCHDILMPDGYMSLVEIKDFNVLIDNKPLFDQPVKSKPNVCGKLIEISRNDDCATGNLLDYLQHQKNPLVWIKTNKYEYSLRN